MRLVIKEKEYDFIFGYGFIKEMNRRYSVTEQGLTMKMGMETILSNFLNKDVETLALAPLAVLPNHQKNGIGKKLVNEAIEKSKELGYKSIVVLGHEHYYLKFGFKKASNYGIKAPFDVPDEAYMVLELIPNALNEVNGVVEYSKAFLI